MADRRSGRRRTDLTHGWVSVLTMVPLDTSVTCTFTFEADHRLEWHPGRCRNLQGHTYGLDDQTAERLAHEAWRLLSAVGPELTAVRLWETPTSRVDLVAGPGS